MTEQEIERYWKEIINSMNDGLVIIDSDGAIRMVNRALERITGYDKDEIIGKSCSVFNCDVCEIARTEGRGKWCLLFDVGKTNMKRCIIRRKDGSYASVFKKASLLEDGRGKVLGAVETITDLSELDRRDRIIEELSRLVDVETGFHGIVGKSAVMRKSFQIIEKAAQSDAPVIVYGASGTGKELAAHAIHELGRRREGPYIQLNCAALNEALLESELFGHVRGAFTGAFRHRQGRFEAAHGGDIFLDEIGDVPMSIQVKLLRVLETRHFERVGDHRPIFADVRIIAATNKDLSELVARKEFREDLFFRINVIPIYLPPLRERMEDIPLLVDHFIRQLRIRTGKDITGLDAEAMRLFMDYCWPGNVRELRSALEYAFVIAERGLIEPGQMPAHIATRVTANRGAVSPQPRPHSHSGEDEERAGKGADEKEALLEALRRCGGNQSDAARKLGVSRVTVWNRMKKYNIDLQKTIKEAKEAK